MNFFAISIPLLIGGGILIWITQKTIRLSRIDQLQHLSELAKMHKEICEKVSIMENKYIELKMLADKLGADKLVHESSKLLEENVQLKKKLFSVEAAAIGPFLKPLSPLNK